MNRRAAPLDECAFCGCALLYEARRVYCDDCHALHQVCDGCVATMLEDAEGYRLAA